MKESEFIDLKKKYNASAFRWHMVKLYRLELVSGKQILAVLNISAPSARPKFTPDLELILPSIELMYLHLMPR